jgi:hypothetical protein
MNIAEIVDALAGLEGSPVADPGDGHERWALYLSAMDFESRFGLPFDAVGLEPDPAITLSLVLRMLDKLPVVMREAWADNIPYAKEREFVRKRIRELSILCSVNEGVPQPGQAEGTYETWSDWLQLQIANSAYDIRVLELLADRGRTKRIRGTADARIRLLRRT